MQRLFFAFTIVVITLLAVGACGRYQATAKKAAVPERREFPVNTQINPCDDFQGYACSLVERSHVLRDDRSRHNFSFHDSYDRILEKKKAYLAALPTANQLTPRGESLRNIYQSCMNIVASKREERQLVGELVQRINSIPDRSSWLRFLAEQVVSIEYSYIAYGAQPNLDDPDWNDLILSVSVRSLPENSYYQNAALMQEWEKIVADTLKTIGVADATTMAKALLNFEKELSAVHPLPREMRLRGAQRRYLARQEWLKKYPNLNLQVVFAHFPERVLVREIVPETYEYLNRAVAELPLEVMKAHYLFHAATDYMDDAYPQNFSKRFAFNHKYFGGPKKRSARDERCTESVMGSFTKEIDAELLPQLFPDFPRQRFIALAEKVRAAILDGLKSNTWLTPASKAGAIKKIKTARLKLVSPENEAEWDFNPPAQYRPDGPYSNMRLLRQNLVAKHLKEMAEKRNRQRWLMGPLTINAYYDASNNQFVMPVGILQYPFYDPNLPDETNLGAVGMVIGHELGHGIDDQGAKYDEKGRLRQWMSDADIDKFKSRGEKLIDQFNKIGHDGRLTLGENIGDLVGMTFSYQAAFGKNQPTREQQQAFFLQYARVWCNVEREENRLRRLKTDPHANDKARVNEQMKHQAGFQEAFMCKTGDPMVLPESERLRIW